MVDKSEKVVWLARVGFAARGLVYVLLGYLALTAEKSDIDDGAGDIFWVLNAIPGGPVVLYVAAAGLVGYAMYRLSAALFDIERKGTSWKGRALRVGYLASAVIHLGLAWTAARIASGARGAGEDSSAQMAGGVLDFPFGSTLLGVIGVGILIAAIFQARSAVTAGFMRHISSHAPSFTCWIGRAGHAARAVVMALIGWSLLRTAWFGESQEVVSLGKAINNLRDMETGFQFVAAGLLLFGIFSIITARYRIIPDPTPPAKGLRTITI
ncbi:DUF1206 domain-containing protein [Novosphingobium sp. ERW19]|uniref:DUF1206 domain-containing protein n=1 Tax=Novosphingobium sp. ERW19 TaxID=2726186 RepID=UPI0014569A5F|nr:DUF1206 domain-containing protein [Novosphingobium sp. ERW19]